MARTARRAAAPIREFQLLVVPMHNAMNAVLPQSYISHRRSVSAPRGGSSVVGQALEHHGSVGRAGSTDRVLN